MGRYLDVTMPKPVAGKASGCSATAVLGCLLRSLANKASGGSIPRMAGCILILSTDKASSKVL